jgi:NADPH2:quinone reductase
LCQSFDDNGGGVVVVDAADPVPGPDEVLIEVTASNVAFVDRLIVRGRYQVRPPLPFTPGVVGAGNVLATGPSVTHLTPGTCVVVLKSDYGTWATKVVVPAWAVAAIPSNVDERVAAAAIEAYGTASYALEERGGLQRGDRVLVLGSSGAVGTAAVEIAVHLDAEVIAVTSDPHVWDDRPVKPHVVLDRRKVDVREEIRRLYPNGVDMVVDPVGGDLAEPALRCLTAYGRYLIVGFASGSIASLPTNMILLRNRTVLGVEWATWITANSRMLVKTLDVVLNRLAHGILHVPQPRTIPLDRLPEELAGPLPPAGLVRTVVVPSMR